jgi:hypothetical protein
LVKNPDHSRRSSALAALALSAAAGMALAEGNPAPGYGPWPYGQPYAQPQPQSGQPYGQPPGQTGWPRPYGQWPPAGPYGRTPPSAQAPYGQMPAQSMPWQYRPAPPDNARGTPPPSGWPAPSAPVQMPAQPQEQQQRSPAYAPGYGSAGYPQGYGQAWPGSQSYPQPGGRAMAAAAPRVEWSLDDTRPYLQQTLALRLSVYSPDNLTGVHSETAPSDDVLIQQIGSTTQSYRVDGAGNRERETRLVLMVTPLRAGDLELPTLRVGGTRDGVYGAELFQAAAESPVHLQVRPPMPSVRPWLPLKSLSIKATVDRPDELRPGEPVTLAIELAAIGGTAGPLPSLEERLATPGLRIYKERTLSDNRLSEDGREVEGKRTEYYTLVPQTGGQLRLPEIAVAWWNVDEDDKRVARLPIRTLEIAGGGGLASWLPALGGFGFAWSRAWVPLVAVLLVLGGYWAGILYRRVGLGEPVPLRQRLSSGLRLAGGLTRSGALAAMRRIKPSPLAARVRSAGLDLIPESSRLLRCVRYANRADSPAEWCERFEQAARAWLRAPADSSAPRMLERILKLRPRADRARVTRLMEQLDAALYGRQDLDFQRWKRDFRRQVGRLRGLFRPSAEPRIRRARLPELNPRAL